MSDSPLDLEPPSETLAALLRAERADAQASTAQASESQANVLARLTATLGPLDAPPPAPRASPPVPPAAPAPPTTVPTASFLASMFTKGGLAMLGLGLLVGGATTAALGPRATETRPLTDTRAALSSNVAATTSASTAPLGEPAVPPVIDVPPAVGAAEPTASARKAVPSTEARAEDGRDPDLERERALLDVARGALARGNASLALRTVDEHAARFPRGRLVEDREALRIKALFAAGRASEAEQSRAAFQTSYPDSFALPRGPEPAASAAPRRVPRAKENRNTLTDPFARPQ